MFKKINWKEPKYTIPTVIYVIVLFVGWNVISLFDLEINTDEKELEKSEYLEGRLPEANVDGDIGSKRQNVIDVYGQISDRSALNNVESDRDSVKKKEEFESRYSADELKLIEEQERQREEIAKLKELNERLSSSAEKVSRQGGGGMVLPMSDEERSRALAMRRNGLMEEMDRDLNNMRSKGLRSVSEFSDVQDSIENAQSPVGSSVGGTTSGGRAAVSAKVKNQKAVEGLSEDADDEVVVKVLSDNSAHFNTATRKDSKARLITAIIDEEIKAVDGSRVRLRLLDDIKVDGEVLKKGTYLYAIMSGFGQQRVKGTVESVLVGDRLIKVGLSLYDVSDGLEGLYIPSSQFSETAKEVSSSAISQNMNLNSGYGGGTLSQWAGQALQNAYQRTTSAIAKAIKKNRARLKYGTQVYLINKNSERSSQSKTQKR